ncbi:hypothetical protein Baya_15198 [Bagarius yarrelli]|uniref:Uncharacterized protein n=1 Tax=Bagarius yarrelli TaxID=175774 RepID=A0A556VBE4_BAGYA|nr:hypothetical protein Baya_15198 [Bagarius yarrelli]
MKGTISEIRTDREKEMSNKRYKRSEEEETHGEGLGQLGEGVSAGRNPGGGVPEEGIYLGDTDADISVSSTPFDTHSIGNLHI